MRSLQGLGDTQVPLHCFFSPGFLSNACWQPHQAACRTTIRKQASLEKCYFSYYRKVENFHNILRNSAQKLPLQLGIHSLFRNKTTPAIIGKSQTDTTKPRKPFIYSPHKVFYLFFNYFLKTRKKASGALCTQNIYDLVQLLQYTSY